MPDWVWGTHAGGPNGGFGGAPYGATERCNGWATMPHRVWGRMRTAPLGASVGLPMGSRNA
eukprot:6390696-Pyramimonas_sp.AAC.1